MLGRLDLTSNLFVIGFVFATWLSSAEIINQIINLQQQQQKRLSKISAKKFLRNHLCTPTNVTQVLRTTPCRNQLVGWRPASQEEGVHHHDTQIYWSTTHAHNSIYNRHHHCSYCLPPLARMYFLCPHRRPRADTIACALPITLLEHT